MFASRRSRALLAMLLLSSTGLAGCLGGDSAPADDAAADGADGAHDVSAGGAGGNATANITDDGSGTMNESVGHMPHLHDYWDGRERVTLLDEDVPFEPFNGLGFTFFQVFARRNAGAGGAFIGLPDGAIVYEGTGKLEFTATWEDPLVTGMTLRYRSAESADFSDPLPITAGVPVVIDVTPAMTDMPHGSTSRWSFFVEPGSGQTILAGFHTKVDIVKMRDIGLFPGHPELFEGKPQKVLLDTDASSTQSMGALRFVTFATGGSPSDDAGVAPTEIVPMETLEMRVDVTIASASTGLGEVSEIILIYKSAETNRWRRAELVEGDVASGKLAFALPVDMKMVDSPYTEESAWRFDVRGSSTLVEGTEAGCGGCTETQVDYHITVTAFDHQVLLSGAPDEDDDD